jgi:hypothetical protein
MERRAFPALPSGEFSARYTHLDFYDTWDNIGRVSEHPDIVVSFENLPTQFVFWRAMSYVPMLVNGAGQWYSNEFNETWNTSGGIGCQEPMDKCIQYVHYRGPQHSVTIVPSLARDESHREILLPSKTAFVT